MRPQLSISEFPELTAGGLEHHPLPRSETIPSTWYTDPRFHALDREAVFAESWQLVGHESSLDEPGSYLTSRLAENPVIVVRGKDRVLRGFYNVCRHRGGPLALDRSGCVKALQCKYHGWTYLLDGTLRGVPQWDRVELFDKGANALVPVAVDTWEGFVFGHLGEPEVPLAEVMGGIAERIAPNRLTGKQLVREVEYEVHANWKVYVDNFLEGYHVPYVHPDLASLLSIKDYHTESSRFQVLQHSPINPEENVYTGESGGGEAFYYWIFPNFMLNILPHRVQVNQVVPDGPDRCRVHFWYYYEVPGSEEERTRIQADVEYSDAVQAEDRQICERVQEGLASRAYDRGRFSVQMEEGVWAFQGMLKRHYRGFARRAISS